MTDVASETRASRNGKPSTATVEREVEAKWRVHPPFVVPELVDGGTGVAAVSEPRLMELTAVYWDTSDLRLAREGVTLRHRSGEGDKDGWQLKLPVHDAGVPDSSSGVRDEIQLPGEPAAVPDELRALITALVRTEVLGPVATLVTARRMTVLLDGEGQPLAELTDDLVSVLSHGHVAGRFREIEVEARGEHADHTLRQVGGVLRSAGAVGGEFVPKVVRALGPQATAEPDPPPPEPVPGKAPAHVAIRSILRRYVRTLIAEDLSLRRGGDDAVHKMRVAARRLRSALRTFRPLLDETWAIDLSTELSWLADSLGDARDHEVQLARLIGDLDRLPDEVVIGDVRDRLERSLTAGMAAGEQRMHEAIGSERYVVLLERLVDAGWEPLTGPSAEDRTETVLPRLVAGSWKDLERRVGKLDDDAERWHKARIAAKRARYAAEAVTPFFGPPARRLAKQLVRVQDVLGEHQDAAVAADTLRGMATAPRIGAAAFTIGVMHARQLEAMRAARHEFADVWRSASEPRLRRWMRG